MSITDAFSYEAVASTADDSGQGQAPLTLSSLSSETIELLHKRGSVRSYAPDPVSDEMLTAILEAARRAPTSSNLQAYSLIVVRDSGTRRILSEYAGNQRHVVEAPVFIAICADLSRVAQACQMQEKNLVGDTLEMGLVATIDAALVGMCATLAADSLGLGSVMIGGMRSRPLEVAELLNLPNRAYVVFGLCVGWPAQRQPPKPRHPAEAVVHFERYEPSDQVRALQAYDGRLAAHYRVGGKPTSPDSWTGCTGREFSKPRRANLRADLARLGFDFR